jgi:putative phosphoribosyl transferase
MLKFMRLSASKPIFENRYDAGKKLSEQLASYVNQSAVVLGIPNGGVAVAFNVALALGAELDLIISRKIPLPLSPEGGFGSVTDDGTIILNEKEVEKAGLTEQQINYQVSKVRVNIRERSLLYRRDRPPVITRGRTVIIVDDGLASGYTMRAAIASLRRRRAKEIIAAVPVGPEFAVKELEKFADKVVTCATGSMPRFYVADFYRNWHDASNEEVLQCLKEWQIRHYNSKTKIQGKTAETEFRR